jgi:hypothetical protein
MVINRKTLVRESQVEGEGRGLEASEGDGSRESRSGERVVHKPDTEKFWIRLEVSV